MSIALKQPDTAVYRATIPAGEPWLMEVKAGQTLRILDLEGNQAVDTLFYSVKNPPRALRRATHLAPPEQRVPGRRQRALFQPRPTDADPRRRHLRAPRHPRRRLRPREQHRALRPGKRYMHSCRDNYLRACAHDGRLGKRDIGPNINFFMNVPVTADGGLTFEDGISAPGKYVDLRAEMDVIVLISNCPQLNNPCNAYNPTPAELLVWN